MAEVHAMDAALPPAAIRQFGRDLMDGLYFLHRSVSAGRRTHACMRVVHAGAARSMCAQSFTSTSICMWVSVLSVRARTQSGHYLSRLATVDGVGQ